MSNISLRNISTQCSIGRLPISECSQVKGKAAPKLLVNQVLDMTVRTVGRIPGVER